MSSLSNITKAMFNGSIIVLNAFIKKLEQAKTNKLGIQAKKTEKGQQRPGQESGGRRRKEGASSVVSQGQPGPALCCS